MLDAAACGSSRRCRNRSISRSRAESCICRCPGTILPRSSPSSATCSRCGRMRPGARAISSSSAASMGWTPIEDVRRIVFDASYLVHGSGRCLSRRAGGDAARSAPSAGDHQIQSGAHLDAGERRRHRRRLSVRVRHGGARRLPVRRPHGADVESLPADCRVREGKPLAAALLRSAALLSGLGATSCCGCGRISLTARYSFASNRRRCGCATTAAFCKTTRLDRALQAAPAGRVRGRARTLARAGRQTSTSPRRKTPQDRSRPAGSILPEGCFAISSPVTGSVWQLKTAVGERAGAGDALLLIEAMKMEIAVQTDQARHDRRRCVAARPAGAAAGDTLHRDAPMTRSLALVDLAGGYRERTHDAAARSCRRCCRESIDFSDRGIWISLRRPQDQRAASSARDAWRVRSRLAAAVRHSIRHQGQYRSGRMCRPPRPVPLSPTRRSAVARSWSTG